MSWYCLTCPPGQELPAAAALEAAGCIVALPLEYRFKRRHETGPAVVYPVAVMPRYLCADLGDAPNWPSILHMEKGNGKRLITGVLGMGREPYALPQLVITYVRQMVLSHLVVPLTRGLMVGDTVIIESGPFAGQRAKVTRVRRGSARVALNLLGALREVDIAKEVISNDCGEKAAA